MLLTASALGLSRHKRRKPSTFQGKQTRKKEGKKRKTRKDEAKEDRRKKERKTGGDVHALRWEEWSGHAGPEQG